MTPDTKERQGRRITTDDNGELLGTDSRQPAITWGGVAPGRQGRRLKFAGGPQGRGPARHCHDRRL